MRGERLRELWGIAGTTGYDFLGRLTSVFIDPQGEPPLTNLYAEFTGENPDYAVVAYEKKRQVLREVLGSDVNRLAALLLEICERHRRMRDYTRHELHDALRELIACFPVYRTYVREEQGLVSDDDVRYVNEAVEAAQARRPDLDSSLLDFIRHLLLLRTRGDVESAFVRRFQQLTGPAMAKGAEDTAFYVYNRLAALSEVGGDPGYWAMPVSEFHAVNCEVQSRWPKTMLGTTTHDTKRSEDVRTRIGLLSEIPECWAQAVRAWSAHNTPHRTNGFPDRNMEYLFYQTLVGAWPIEAERAVAYMEKASREAKANTSWTNPNRAYDEALRRFIERALADGAFRAQVERFVEPLVLPARVTALAQALLKLTCPGVPDIYQGAELWTSSLVDPDNRRPIDYETRRRLLADLEHETPEGILARIDEGLPKLWVVRQALHLRKRRPQAFGVKGDYRPRPVSGAAADHVIAFSRGEAVVTIVPRLVVRRGGEWGDTAVDIGAGRWRNELTGESVEGGSIALGSLLARFPVALLARAGGD
jgi:(1->4)-alpha-D-glucan 1-alpha-D-glucosylmutase